MKIGNYHRPINRQLQYKNKTMDNPIQKRAKDYYTRQQDLLLKDEWGYDRHTQDSSGARGTIVAESGEQSCSIWSINHYLGFNRHPYVIDKAREALGLYGTGCGTSAMSGGHSQLHKKLIDRLAAKLNKEEVILYPTGFTANSGAISTLCSLKSTLILIDRDCHGSIIEGCRASGAKYLPFKHNSVIDLEAKLEKYSGKFDNVFVMVESIYSMGGDTAPLKEIAALKEHHNFLLLVDEAHTFGLFGEKGAGLCCQLGIEDKVDFITTTLSKATASIGGVVATTKEFASLLKWSPTHVFQAAIPPADVAAIDACLDLIDTHPSIIKSLMNKTADCRKRLERLGLDLGQSTDSPIIPVYIRDYDILRAMEKELFNRGIFTVAVIPPAVKHSEVRFRFIINDSHTEEEIDELIYVLGTMADKFPTIIKN